MKKKNYMAPSTEMINLATEGIMQSLNVITGSGSTFSEAQDID